ncbi:MAG: hypothetical protein BGN97_16245 [Microbacterium sp. 69-10]|uniref:DUF885 domain-containing protein n=1 Tax=Microbacterium sp. 69-10 TaxID=1895783 RepID=UPI0009683B19|nr:DUF885 domain-containing protein [Microbacterium sp. 69-10]OJU41282.1 MAG: hypothetical protein BGN97_16245 [Microbacterium sp. 69-10]
MNDTLAALGETYFEAKHTYDPFNATLLGLTEFDGILGSPSAETSDSARAVFASVREQAESLDPATLDAAEAVDRDVLVALARGAETDAQHSLWAANISGKGYVSRQGTLLQALAATTVNEASGAEQYLDRLAALPDYLTQLGERYRHELASGRTPTAVGVRNAARQLREEADGEDGTLLRPVASPAGAAWRDRAEALAARVVPALGELAELLDREAMPFARPDDKAGVCWMEGGEEAYADELAKHTTTDLSAERVHELGREALRELDQLWSEIGEQAFGVTDRVTIQQRLRSDPELRATSRQQLVDIAEGALRRAEAALPEYFPTDCPIGPCDIVELTAAESANSAMAYYRPPTVDGSRNGAQCLATADPTSRYRYEYEALSFHESVPGHHLQLATSQLLNVPRYRRHLDVEVCGFNEGWGLYSEQLADELGLYSDVFARLGRLSFQALRACRMVVDTGMHAMGWSRQRAIDFMFENTATTLDHVVHEVDRYLAWPGQCCAYGVGKREILRMRAHARQELGDAFDLPGFHWAVVSNGAVPVSVAFASVDRWIASQR